MLIGDKRNFGVENCTHDIIVHQDDDDFYFPDSILAKIRIRNNIQNVDVFFK